MSAYLRVALVESLLFSDDLEVFIPAESLGSVTNLYQTLGVVEVCFDNAIITGDRDGLRVAKWTINVKPEQLKAINR